MKGRHSVLSGNKFTVCAVYSSLKIPCLRRQFKYAFKLKGILFINANRQESEEEQEWSSMEAQKFASTCKTSARQNSSGGTGLKHWLFQAVKDHFSFCNSQSSVFSFALRGDRRRFGESFPSSSVNIICQLPRRKRIQETECIVWVTSFLLASFFSLFSSLPLSSPPFGSNRRAIFSWCHFKVANKTASQWTAKRQIRHIVHN